MSKIVKAINVMISNEEMITNAIKGVDGDEVFFVYDKKHKWSLISADNGEFFELHYYPGSETIEQLALLDDEGWDDFTDMVSYSSKEIGGREAKDSLSELYTILKEKLFGMDEVLNDIIRTDEVPF